MLMSLGSSTSSMPVIELTDVAAFVDRVVGDVRVRVDDARRDELAGAVEDVGAGGNRHVRADRGDLAVAHHARCRWRWCRA